MGALRPLTLEPVMNRFDGDLFRWLEVSLIATRKEAVCLGVVVPELNRLSTDQDAQQGFRESESTECSQSYRPRQGALLVLNPAVQRGKR
jgi:hypothetical protein